MTVEHRITHPDPYLSVVVPSLPDHDLSALVSALRNQQLDEFEAIFVVDESLGVCEARNRGVEEASGDVIAFTDDDCEPPSEWLSVIAEAFRDDPDLVILEGPVGGYGNYDGTRKYPTCNLAVRRSAIESAGGFRPEYEYWREDTEFGWRIEAEGTARYDDRMYMVHKDRPRAEIIEENERRLEREYPEKYSDIIVPDTILGRINDWLWRHGFWDRVDDIRYRGEH
ncbi:glycosyltransferase family 2 protein [Halarchaeum nitratireducens]|uniref:Glycosyltransferase 2-like domain-containing protein n=1 Tax=Halarchaeum nitratireducens TaxID=489913 RepID=A0A830GEI9_9EURY|nr:MULTISPECIES: glycosyltransferase family A protein [Halarchaeum]MBP2252621.1 GT2 family glycosyltransferase [Halarchaeum solikamskense]GGN23751.1 hypothetical protein GCM10009021_26700 [Halarchaeum nitratireducens]